jgi:hypothetical protein
MSPSATFPPTIEPLESRIAPSGVTIFVGRPDPDTNDTNYSNPSVIQNGVRVHDGFHSTNPATNPGTDPTVNSYLTNDPFNANFVGGMHTFYIKLTAGDVIKLFNDTAGYQPFLTVTKGNVVAFFVDKGNAPNNEVDANELTGLSFGAGSSIAVRGDVDGDIVSNFNALTGKISPTTLVSSLQTLAGLSVDNLNLGDSAHGSIISGGAMTTITAKSVNKIVTGSAADGYTYDFNSTDTGNGNGQGNNMGGATLAAFAKPIKTAAPGISIVNVGQVDVIQASDGGVSAPGGSLSKISIGSDSNGFTLQAGKGGDGLNALVAGGAGGAVNTVFVQGTADLSSNSADNIVAGNGGTAFGIGTGGAGGSASAIFVGFSSVLGVPVESTSLLKDNVVVQSGTGGDGNVGGVGGLLTNAKIATIAPDLANAHEISVIAGNGGHGTGLTTSSHAGAGGSISLLTAKDEEPTATAADIAVTAGSAGTATAPGNGANGGSITTASLLTFNATVTAGDGSAGQAIGGSGGGVTGLTMLDASPIVTHTLTVDAGIGGNVNSGKAGAGGAISGIQMLNGDLSGLTIDSGMHGNGGIATVGTGGAGGAVGNIQIIDTNNDLSGNFALRTGTGGDGTIAGGLGGGLTTLSVFGTNLNYSVATGAGGNASGLGKAGAGGNLMSVSIDSTGLVGGNNVTGSITAGNGGTGSGAVTLGGAGGKLTTVNAIADGNLTVQAGTGGSGSGATPGAGGSILGANVDARFGNAMVLAGNAGTNGTGAALGGSIGSANVEAQTDITITGGNGSHGGAGGALTTVGFANSHIEFTGFNFDPVPDGTVTIKSGAGSGGGLLAGAGGNITGLTGYVGKNINAVQDGGASIDAGNGGGVSTAEGAGGTINGVVIRGGGGGGAFLTIQAGDAGNPVANPGNSAGVRLGANGGSVTNVAVDALTAGSVFRSITAGDGGNAGAVGGIGGLGGSVSFVNVVGSPAWTADIGVRSGQHYGFTKMGGIFAGLGGNFPANGIPVAGTGAAGNVTNITADAIAAIVAGRGAADGQVDVNNNDIPRLATTVSSIYLNGNTATKVDNTGAYTNFSTANLVGGVMTPTAAKANTFDTGEYDDNNNDTFFDYGDAPQDGLIAAITLSNLRNFVPEAYLYSTNPLVDANHGFFDYKNGM